MTDTLIAERTARVLKDAFVWDFVFPFFDYYAFSLGMSGAQAGLFDPKYRALERYRAGGCHAIGLTVAGNLTDVAITMKLISANLAYFSANADRYVLATSAAELKRAKAQGKTAVVLNFQGSDSLAGHADMVEAYYRLGVRSMLLTYNLRTHAGSGCHERTDDGLSTFGIAVVREMNRVGMWVDASHTGYRTTLDLFEHSTAPVIFSHSNPSALQPHPRNISDEQIKLCAKSGGAIGVVGFDGFLPGQKATADAVVLAIDHIAQLVGARHVALGLDWVYCEEMFRDVLAVNKVAYPTDEKGGYVTRAEFFPPDRIPEIAERLLQRGYGEADVRAILGENWLRLAEQVWK